MAMPRGIADPGQEALDREERRREVPIDGGTPALFAGILDRAGACEATASVGNKEFHRSQLALNLTARRLDLREFGDVGNNQGYLTAGAIDLLRGAREGRLVSVAQLDDEIAQSLKQRSERRRQA
jgi:hypothetical protein